jgi:hypothetical protein
MADKDQLIAEAVEKLKEKLAIDKRVIQFLNSDELRNMVIGFGKRGHSFNMYLEMKDAKYSGKFIVEYMENKIIYETSKPNDFRMTKFKKDFETLIKGNKYIKG